MSEINLPTMYRCLQERVCAEDDFMAIRKSEFRALLAIVDTARDVAIDVLANPSHELLDACAANFSRRVQEERTRQWQEMIDAGAQGWQPFSMTSWEDIDSTSKEAYIQHARWYLEGAAEFKERQ